MNVAYNNTNIKIEYRMCEDVITNQCFMHDIENDVVCTLSAIKKSTVHEIRHKIVIDIMSIIAHNV